MVRALSLQLPWWPIEWRQRAGLLERHRHILLVRTVANRQTVVYACRSAVAVGVRPEMTLAHARALLSQGGEPQVCEHDPQRDFQSLGKLARWAIRFAPRVASDGKHGLLMDVTGCARLYHGEQNLLVRLRDAVTRLGFTASSAIAPTYGSAWALACYRPSGCVIVESRDQIRQVLAPLPIGALRIDNETIKALEEVGVRRVGQLLGLPADQLPSRFCDDLVLRIDQVLGAAIETIEPLRIPLPLKVAQHFLGPVKNIEAIHMAVRKLLKQFSNCLFQRQVGARKVQVTLVRHEAGPVHLSITISHPVYDAHHLWQLVQPKIEQANLGYGLEAIKIEAIESDRLSHRQQNLSELDTKDVEQEHLGDNPVRLLDTLIHRYGLKRVLRMRRVESHLSERAVQRVPIRQMLQAKQQARAVAHDRPTQLFDQPEVVEIQAASPEGPVIAVTWRGHLHRVAQCAGPERLANEWWRRADGSRDYFKVQIETGLHLWLYRDLQLHRWFIHGWWA